MIELISDQNNLDPCRLASLSMGARDENKSGIR